MAWRRAGIAAAALLLACAGEQGRQPPPVEQAPAPEAPPPTEPPPPPPPLPVVPRSLAFDALGDTVRIAYPGGSSCRSAQDSVATVDEYGLVRAVSNGSTHVRCWLGFRTGIVRVEVQQQVARIAITADFGLNIPRPGDSLHLGLARVDRLGTSVSEAAPEWTSLQPDLVQVGPSTGIAVGVADSGSARVVASVGGLTDTVTVELGFKPVQAPLLSQATRTSARARAAALRARGLVAPAPSRTVAGPGATPAERRAALNHVGVRDVLIADSLNFQDPSLPPPSRRRFLVPYAVATAADHAVEEAGALERNSGVMFGIGADVVTRGWLRASFSISTGNLGAQTSAAREQKVTDGRFSVGIAAFPWLTLTAGVQSRVYRGLSESRWLLVRTGGELHFDLAATPLSGIASLDLLPVVSLGSGSTSPNFGMTTAFGVGFERGRLKSSIRYFLESYNFPSQAGGASRSEQYSGLEFRLGLLFGW